MANVVGKLKAILNLDKSRYDKGLNKAGKKTSKFAGMAKKAFAGIGAALGVRAVGRMINKTATLADSLGKLSKQTGFTTETLQKYQFAAERSGVSSEKMNTSLAVFQKRLGELRSGTGSLYTRLKKMDPAFMDQLKAANSAQEAFRMYADRMQNASSETEQAALAQAGFSRAGLDMTRLLREGSAGLDKYSKMAEKTGGILSGDLIKAAEEYKDQQTNMNMAFRGLKGIILKTLLPAIKKWMGRIQKAAKWVKENSEAILKWGKVIGSAVTALGAARVAMMAFNAVLKANPIGLIISLIGSLIAALTAAWKESETFRAVVKYVVQSVIAFFKKAWISIKFGAKLTWDKVKGFFTMIADAAKTVWKSIKAIFQKGKSPADVWKKGFEELRKNAGKVGKETRKEWNKELDKIKSPDYQKILDKEKAKSAAKEAGKEAGNEFANSMKKGMQEAQPGKPGFQKKSAPEKQQGVGFSGFSTEQVQPTLKSMDHIIKKNKKMQQQFQNSQQQGSMLGGVLKNAFQGMSNSISDALKNGENVLKSFWTFFKNWIKGLIIKLVAAAAAAALLVTLLGATGLSIGGVSGLGGGGFIKMTKMIGGFGGANMAEGGIIPSGYPNDSYPAMLSSGEQVYPPDRLPSKDSGTVKITGEFKQRGSDLVASINEQRKKENRAT